ncbi:hypothetical protein ABZ820_10865 [Streptomyces diacarni]|uniref:hypothetical protein n=1 Tax=Streptomyces diacarni TaxID=2800381 RepID=UPI0033D5409F
MRNPIRNISIGRLADVVTLESVLLEATPGLLQHLNDVPLGNTLLHAPGEHLRGLLLARAVEADRLVCRQQRYAHSIETMLDEGTEVGPTRYPLDGLADDRIEVALARLSERQKILNTTVARYRDVEALVPSAVTPRGEVFAPGLNVVVEAGDDDAGGQH